MKLIKVLRVSKEALGSHCGHFQAEGVEGLWELDGRGWVSQSLLQEVEKGQEEGGRELRRNASNTIIHIQTVLCTVKF